MKYEIVKHLIDDAFEETKSYCQVRNPQPRLFYHYYDLKYNPKHFEVYWTSRKAIISTGLHKLVTAFPETGDIVEELCQKRQSLPKKMLRRTQATKHLVYEQLQAPWRVRDFPHEKFRWSFIAMPLMQNIAVLHHLGLVGKLNLTPEEPGEILEWGSDVYQFSMC